MDAKILNLQSLFGDQVSYQIPQFQRPYAWKEEGQWFPLWEDIRNLAERHIAAGGQGKVKPHFMGAIVLQHRPSAIGEVSKWLVVDGQQRLTTLQLLIKAVQLVFQQSNDDARFERMRDLTENSESHLAADSDNQTKIRQSNTNDQRAFQDAIRVTFLDEQGDYWPITKAFRYFKRKAECWLSKAKTPEDRMRWSDALEEAFAKSLLIAVIDLDEEEEPHIIFETLNARGEVLRQSDLVKNTVMYEADVVDHADKARQLWGMFDLDQWWRKGTSESRLDRIELDRLLNHWMIATRRTSVAPDRTASDFRVYLDSVADSDIERVASRIRKSGLVYKDALSFNDPDSFVQGMLRRLIGDMGIITIMPVILYLKDAQIPEKRYRRCIQILESYLVRRMLYGNITQGLMNLLISLLEKMHQDRPTDYEETMAKFFHSQTSDSLVWPTDGMLFTRLTDSRLRRGTIQRRKMVLVEIERSLRSDLTESLGDVKNLTIEHIMPRQWDSNWPLPYSASPEDRERREDRVHFLGNMTLVTGKLNSTLSNASWQEKKETLGKHSLLRLNQGPLSQTEWNEGTIERRGQDLASSIIDIWKPADYFLSGR
ncbi:MAG: DUF262 domain-containing protein [Chloroflexi bacterium]|nr:DUF262 domain-containing protein [Chloroflexota bacterium]